MRWRGERESDNVEDRRGFSGGGRVAIGGGIGTFVIIIIALLLGADPRQLLQQVPDDAPPPTSQGSRQTNPEEDELKKFVSVVLGKTEDVRETSFVRTANSIANLHLYFSLVRCSRLVD